VELPSLSCSGEDCQPVLAVRCLNYSGYYLVGLGVADWVGGGGLGELSRLLLPNGTTLAVYNVSLLNATGSELYWRPVIVTSVRAELWAYYGENGVNLVWNVSYTHLAPDWLHEALNVTEPLKPYQRLKCRLYREGRVEFQQDLGVVPTGLNLPDSPYHSYAGLYVSHGELRERLGFDSPTMTAAATWTAVEVPLSESSTVRFVPAGIELRSLSQDGTWRWEVAPVEIPGNVPGEYVRTGGEMVVYFNGTRRAYELGEGEYIVRFTTPRFEIGRRTLVLRFAPRPTRNRVYFFYPFEF